MATLRPARIEDAAEVARLAGVLGYPLEAGAMAARLRALLPLLRFERPFFAMNADARARFLTHVEARGSYFARQSLTTLKMLACFALYEDDAVRGGAS